MEKVQIIAILVSVLFLIYIGYLIARGKLREEYSIIWILCTVILVIFSFWRKGLDFFSNLVGIIDPPNMVFTFAIFVILIYLLHLSIVVSKLHKENKTLAQEIALMKRNEKEKADQSPRNN
jgi:hypothetical protein